MLPSVVGILHRALAVVSSVVSFSAVAVAGGTGTGTAAPAPGGADAVRAVHTVTLVTGDVVQLSTLASGRQVATVDGARDVQISYRDGDVHVLPEEALPYVTSGQVDDALFNVTDLVADGYHDQARTTLPLLVAGPRVTALAGAARGRELSSIGAVAVAEDKSRARDFWASVTADAATLTAGVRRVWLDRQVRATLSDSVPRIGAPAAWRAGYDGSGVKVAVLDSGYDPTHPDLAGRVSAATNFTDESGPEDATDRHGHGTHVAATIAGRGDSSGVAPGAELLVGKVLNQRGSGAYSWFIAGMEWAVSQGARVVNVSLGGRAVEGGDVLTQAVDALTASSGALFVVSAGNNGPGPETITSPGTATSALTVGAVSKEDAIADFSSRGPRIGDGAPKPEIVAPGVGIVAARAAGTSLGEVVDGAHTSLSGTSMAAPHVAGAAALLAQRNPKWTAAELKAALVTSARPVRHATVPEQGAGLVNVPAALDQPVRADTAAIAFGTDADHAAIGLSNTGTRPVTVRLSADATSTGAVPKRAALTVSPEWLTIPPGGTATATVRLDAAVTPPGAYAGLLTVRGAGVSVRIPVGLRRVPPMHRLTISAVDRHGRAPDRVSSIAQIWSLDTGKTSYGYLQRGAPAVVEVPAGRYLVVVPVGTVDEAGQRREVTVAAEPDLTVDGDVALHFDTRAAVPVRIDTPLPTQTDHVGVSWHRVAGARSDLTGWSYNTDLVQRVSVLPTRPVSVGSFAFHSRWDLMAPVLAAEVAGAGGFTLDRPRALDRSPLLDGAVALPLVDGGDGTPAELAGARDAVVLLRYRTRAAVAGQVRAAGEAGARLALFAADQPGYWDADAQNNPLPAYYIEHADGQRLRERLALGAVSLALTGTPLSPYRFDLFLPEPGGIPADPHYGARELRLATVDADYHAHAPGILARENRSGFAAGLDVAFSFSRAVQQAQRRTDYVNTPGITWLHQATADAEWLSAPMGTMSALARTYRPGERTSEVWFPALTRPALPATDPDLAAGAPVNRAHDAIRVAIPHYADGGVGAYGWIDNRSDRAQLTLRRDDGTIVGQSTAARAQFTVPAGDERYRLTLDVARDKVTGRQWWTTSTATSTTWTFHSRRPRTSAPTVLPLLQVGLDIATDLSNVVDATRTYPLVLRPGYQPGARGPGGFTVAVQVSYDDGAQWTMAPVRGRTATVPAAPPGAQFATIRVTAEDRAGNRIEQTITHAWRLPPPLS